MLSLLQGVYHITPHRSALTAVKGYVNMCRTPWKKEDEDPDWVPLWLFLRGGESCFTPTSKLDLRRSRLIAKAIYNAINLNNGVLKSIPWNEEGLAEKKPTQGFEVHWEEETQGEEEGNSGHKEMLEEEKKEKMCEKRREKRGKKKEKKVGQKHGRKSQRRGVSYLQGLQEGGRQRRRGGGAP